MFGTLTIYKDGLNEEEKAEYQRYYCGLCRELRRRFGLKSQLILTYDCTFLGMLLNGVYEDGESVNSSFCSHKMKRVETVRNRSLEYAADMNLLLSYQNYTDRAHDFKKGKLHKAAAMAVRALRRDYLRVAKQYPRQTKALERYMEALHSYEEAPDENPDFAANLTGEMLAEIFDEREDRLSDFLKNTGYYLGKFIYLSDAFEDVEEDEASGDYNPFKKTFREPEFADKTEDHLVGIMAECTKNFELLPVIEHREILRNILYSGIWIPFFHAKKTREESLKAKETREESDVL